MGRLIWKDFVLQKRTAYFYLIIGSLFFFYLDAMDQRNMMAAMLPAFMIVYGFMHRTVSEDEKNNAIRMVVALPLPRADIVKAKYASVAIVAVLSLAIFLTAGKLAGAYSLQDPQLFLLQLGGFLLTGSLLVSIFLPMVYKIGAIRAQTINRYVFFGLFALGTTIGTLANMLVKRLGNQGPPAWLEKLAESLSALNSYAGVVLLFSLAALIYVLSLRLSIRFLENRELF